MVRPETMEVLYKIPVDNRDLNYAKYFPYGKRRFLLIENRNSINTEHCAVIVMIQLLLKSDFIHDELSMYKQHKPLIIAKIIKYYEKSSGCNR